MLQIRIIIMFIATMLVFLFIANAVVFKALTLSFNVMPPWLLITILAVCGLSFIASLFLGRNYYNKFTRVYSRFSMIWTGFFAYLFLASVLYIVIVAFITDQTHIIAFTMFGVAIVVSAYGIIHAQVIQVKHINVNLNHLPQSWHNKKILFISDLHIGQINGKNFVELLVQKIQKIAPDIVFIGGDLFDGSSTQGILHSISPLSKLNVPLGMYFVMGNHEGYGSAKIFLDAIRGVGINVLRDEKIIIDGIQVIGVDYITTAEKNNFKHILDMLAIDKNIPSILLKHEPRHISVSEQAGISLQLSGHTHKAQQWPFEYVARLQYGRFTYGLQRSNEFQTYTSSGVGTWGPPLRVGTNSEIVVITLN